MVAWIRHNALKVICLLLTACTFLSYQNCSKMNFQQATVDQASKANMTFACSQPTVACEVGGFIGSMSCVSSNDGNVWGACETPQAPNTPRPFPGSGACLFKGVTYLHGQSFTAYQSGAVAASGDCISEMRTCINGAITGSFQHLSCVRDSGECELGGQKIAHGADIKAYSTARVPYGQTCAMQNRFCKDRVLTGSYSFLSCVVDPPATCNFNGQVIAHTGDIKAYQAASVPFGQTCQVQNRICTNGNLSGSYLASSCMVQPPANCTLNGQPVLHGASVVTYQTASVPFGQSCKMETRSCSNGNLSGSYSAASCTVQPAANCSLNGQPVGHGVSVVAYKSVTVPYGQSCQMETRSCTNGSLSGSFAHSSCSVDSASTCNFNGQTVNHAQAVTAYQAASVPFGQSCQSQSRSCDNGVLSGNFMHSSCTVAPAANCNFNGQAIAHGQSVTAYGTSAVPYGSSCAAQIRTCDNGNLNGNFAFSSCEVLPAANCNFNGQAIAHGQAVTAFSQSTVAYGSQCSGVQQTRVCDNGSLSGDAAYNSCSVLQPANCVFNGQVIAHGQSIAAFQNSSVSEPATCAQENRTCDNGNLGGSYAYPSCVQLPDLNSRHYIYSACVRTNNGQTMACGYADPYYMYPERVCSGNIILGGYYGHKGELGYMVGVAPDQIFVSPGWSVMPPLANVPGARCVVSYKWGYGYAPPFGEQQYRTIYFDGDPVPGALNLPYVTKGGY